MWEVVKEITSTLLSNSYHEKKNKQSSIIQQQVKIESQVKRKGREK